MVNRENFKLYRKYLTYLEEVQQLDRLTRDKYRKELAYVLEWADETPLERAPSIKPPFPRWVATVDGNADGKPITAKYARRVCRTARTFLTWCRITEGTTFKDITEPWLATLTMQKERVGRVTEHQFYTEDEVRKLISLPANSLTMERDQAAAAFLFLSAMRVGAFVTLSLECVDLDTLTIRQWPDLRVQTKNDKAGTTTLLDIPDFLEVVRKWDAYLRDRLPASAMWYASVNQDGSRLTGSTEAEPERRGKVAHGLKRLCRLAGVTYKSPHKLRHGFTMYGLERADTISDLKAISQNLMHASLSITDSVYGILRDDQAAQRIQALSKPKDRPTVPATAGGEDFRSLSEKLDRLTQLMEGKP